MNELEAMIEVNNLKKSFGLKEVIKGINLHIQEGSFCALLGVNGAGKSTTIDILCTLCCFDAGSVKLNGYERYKEDEKIREHIGIVFQTSALDQLLSVKENLILRSRFYSMSKKDRNERIQTIADLLELNDIMEQKVATLSGGQKRKCDIARALLSKPSLLILDEPTTGLDPNARVQIWNCIKSLQKHQKLTIFLSTHYMEEAAMGDHIIILDHGLIIEEGTPLALRDKYTFDYLILYPYRLNALAAILQDKQISFLKRQDQIIIKIPTCFDAFQIVQQVRMYINSFEVKLGSLEDAFLNILKLHS